MLPRSLSIRGSKKGRQVLCSLSWLYNHSLILLPHFIPFLCLRSSVHGFRSPNTRGLVSLATTPRYHVGGARPEVDSVGSLLGNVVRPPRRPRPAECFCLIRLQNQGLGDWGALRVGAVLRTATCRPSSRMVVEPRAHGNGSPQRTVRTVVEPGRGQARAGVRASAVTARAAGGEDFPAFGASSLRVTWASEHLGRWTAAWKGGVSFPGAGPPQVAPGEGSQGIYLAGVGPYSGSQ